MSKKIPLKYRILMIACLILFPVLLVFQYYVSLFVRQVNKQMATELSGSLTVFMKSIEEEFRNADSFLFNKFWISEDLLALGKPLHPAEQAAAIHGLRTSSQEFLENNLSINAILLYNPTLNLMEGISSSRSSYLPQEKPKVLQTLFDFATGGKSNLGWSQLAVDNRTLLVRIASRGDTYCMLIADLVAIGRNAQRDYALSAPVVFWNNGGVLNTAHWIQSYTPTDAKAYSGYYLLHNKQARHLVVTDSFMDITAAYGAPYRDMGWLRVSILTYLLVITLTFLIAWLAVRRSVFIPLYKLEQVMQRIRDGNMEERSNDFASTEFARVNETFNQMIGTINRLKIDSYERQLQSNRLEMEALRLQIRPHFYLNCLKNLYALSQIDNNDAVQRSILYLSDHLRYTFELKKERVSLQEELEMCHNYLRLQDVGQKRPTLLTLSVESNVTEFVVPPISLLTLVENCFKHGVQMGRQLQITITARQYTIDDSHMISLLVSDNGLGFPPDILEQMNYRLDVLLESSCVGLRNVVRRFQLLYGDRFSITFHNRNGAVVELLIQL